MNNKINLTIEGVAESIQGSEDVIGRIDYLKEILEERRKFLEEEYMGCEEEYVIGDVMNLLDHINNKFQEQFDEGITTFFHGDINEVGEFISEYRELLGRHVSMDFRKSKTHESDSENSWLISAYVSMDEINKFNLTEGWLV
jgi:hypothetical protein|tara:strand:+ start:477 stop:902 length:426 start_codon:yes stop_codon:yes gene_type:complete